MTCEDCNYYTEKHPDIRQDIQFCVKQNIEITNNKLCVNYDDGLNCYDCPRRYMIYYELNDISHYCKKFNRLLYQQDRSVLYKGDLKKLDECKS